MEESERAAKYLQDAGYDMLNCDNGTYDAGIGLIHQDIWIKTVILSMLNILKLVDIPVVCR